MILLLQTFKRQTNTSSKNKPIYTYNSKYVYIFFAISLQTPMRNSLVKVCFTEQNERSGCCEMLSMYTWRACR